ncbi:MAG: metallophosphoesterase [Candidatus Pacearchaeota archaeon]|nr:MAG: metallophosphoesterase [Candidatus Pacearchaeota archaeon]
MEILPGIEIKGKSLWLPKRKILIIADLHIGYEEALVGEGFLAPRTMFKEMKKELQELLKLKPKIIIIDGDLKHEFGLISRQEWHETSAILDLLLKKCKVILIKGNHDTILEPIAKKKELSVKNFYCFNDVCVLHGHKILLDEKVHDSKTLIIAHEHPAVSIKEDVKQEIYKCFLLGKWKNKKLVVMPSFFTIFEGSDVKKEKLLSPFLNERKIKNFKVFVLGDKVYRFGKLKNIK